jgi:hypothetical protein
MSGILSDGSNAENCEPVPALNWSSTSDFTNVVVHGPMFSFVVTKLRTFLVYAKIEYKHEQHLNDKPQGMKTGTPYQKVNLHPSSNHLTPPHRSPPL